MNPGKGGAVQPTAVAMNPRPFFLPLLAFASAALLAGCGEEPIRVYTVPKETLPPSAREVEPSLPRSPSWQTPEGWEQLPATGMRAAAFRIPNRNGPPAELIVVPLPAAMAGEVDYVNLWRDQLHLQPIEETQLPLKTTSIVIGGQRGSLYEITSEKPLLEGKPACIAAAILTHGDHTWFFKMTGADDHIHAQKPAFLEFLQTIRFEEANHIERRAWNAPPHWQQQPPSAMRKGSFLVRTERGSADISIIVLPGEAGGLLANVNRWRGQIGLEPIGESELERTSAPMAGATNARVVDMAGVDQHTVAVVVPRGEQTWFFKMTGAPAVVEAEKAAFLKFVETVDYAAVP